MTIQWRNRNEIGVRETWIPIITNEKREEEELNERRQE